MPPVFPIKDDGDAEREEVTGADERRRHPARGDSCARRPRTRRNVGERTGFAARREPSDWRLPLGDRSVRQAAERDRRRLMPDEQHTAAEHADADHVRSATSPPVNGSVAGSDVPVPW